MEHTDYSPEDEAVNTPELAVATVPRRETKGGTATDVMPLVDALTLEFDSDVHMLQHAEPTRVLKDDVAAGTPLRMVALFFDVDGPKHGRSPEWDADIRERATRLPGSPFGYWTRSGARIVYTLKDPIVVDSSAAWEAWSRCYLLAAVAVFEASGIVCDPLCADATRLFRVPHGLRDGVRQQHGWLCGKPTAIGEFDLLAVEGLDLHEAELALSLKCDEWAKRIARKAPPVAKAPVRWVAENTSERMQAALRWLAKQEPAIERKHGGSNAQGLTWDVCTYLTRVLELSVDDALAVLDEWNARCVPPWSQAELRRQLINSMKRAAS